LVVILVCGWTLTQSLGNLARERVLQDRSEYSQQVVQHLVLTIKGVEKAVKSMSGSPWIGPALWTKDPIALQQANSVLDGYQKDFGVSVAYILDHSGKTIASSNRQDPDSFVGQSYAFRPYFQQAIAGKSGNYFALGITSRKRGFYASYPVHDQGGKIAGAAVLKVDMDQFAQDLRSIDPAFLIDANGIVFIASRPELSYKSLGWVSPEKKADIVRQYGTDQIQTIFPKKPEDGSEIDFSGQHFLVSQQSIDPVIAPGWSLVSFASIDLVVMYRLLGIGITLFITILTLFFASSNLLIRDRAIRNLASEARFRAMFNAAPEAVFVTDAKTRKIVDANPFMSNWIGYSRDELIGMKIDELQEPKGIEINEDLTKGGGNRGSESRNWRYRRKDGTLADVEKTSATLIYQDNERELIFVRDITDRKRAEEDLRASEEKYRLLFEKAPLGIMHFDYTGTVTDCNGKFTEIIGATRDKFAGFNMLRRMRDEKMREAVAACLEGKTGYYEGNYLSVLGGKQTPVRAIYQGIFTPDGKLLGGVGIFEDITERKQAEDALQKAYKKVKGLLDERNEAEDALQKANETLKRLLIESDRQNRNITLLNELSEQLQICQAPKEVYDIAAYFLSQFFPEDSAALYVFSNSGSTVEKVAAWGKPPPKEDLFASDDCWALRRSNTYLVEDDCPGPFCKHVTEPLSGCYLCVPLVGQGEVMGIIHLQVGSNEKVNVLDGSLRLPVKYKEQLVESCAKHLGLSLANLKLRESLHTRAIRDPLTGQPVLYGRDNRT
jgi:PAS domain S-box-containing protein